MSPHLDIRLSQTRPFHWNVRKEKKKEERSYCCKRRGGGVVTPGTERKDSHTFTVTNMLLWYFKYAMQFTGALKYVNFRRWTRCKPIVKQCFSACRNTFSFAVTNHSLLSGSIPPAALILESSPFWNHKLRYNCLSLPPLVRPATFQPSLHTHLWKSSPHLASSTFSFSLHAWKTYSVSQIYQYQELFMSSSCHRSCLYPDPLTVL